MDISMFLLPYNSTTGNVQCMVPPYDQYTQVRFKLIFFGNYEVNNTVLYFNYVNLNIIDDFSPKQSHISGGLDVVITGNFTSLVNQTFKLFFGSVETTTFTLDSAYQITVEAPTVADPRIVEIRIEIGSESYNTGSNVFTYKNYFEILSITPDNGPSRGGTVVQLLINGTISEAIYCVFGTDYSAPVIVSANKVDCKSPPNSFGTVEVNLIVPGIYTTASKLMYNIQ